MNLPVRFIVLFSLLTSIFFFAVATKSYADDAANENIVKIVYVDSSIVFVHEWSFLYKYAAKDKEPPEGYTWAISSQKHSRELHLQKRKDQSSLTIRPEEIDRIVMRWREDPKIKKRTRRVEYTLVKKNGERIDMDNYGLDPSFLTDKKFLGLRSLYLSGNVKNDGNVVAYEINLGYSNWALFKNDKAVIPLEVVFP